MSNEMFDSVWNAIEDTAAEAENMKLRSGLMMALSSTLTGRAGTRAKPLSGWASLHHSTRVSDLMRGKILLFGLDTLVNMVVAAGLHVEMRAIEAA